MSKFGDKQFTPSTTQSSGSSGQSNVDWDALNKYVAETVQSVAGCEEGTPAGVVGIISGIVDYGKHQDPERIEPMNEGDQKTKDWKKKQVDSGKATVDDEGNFHYQAPPCQEVGFFVDFPSITVDKGQFFGDSNPAPYRVLLGGVFKGEPAQKTKVQGYPNNDNKWVFSDTSRATKLAKAAKLKDLKDGFEQSRLLELIGCAMQFNMEVFVNSAGFLQEKITNPSPLMVGIPVPEYNEDLLFYVGMTEDNEPDYVKVLIKPVKEYIKAAIDYEGSKLKSQIEALESSQQASTNEPKQTPVEGSKSAEKPSSAPQYNEPPMDFDDDIPFIQEWKPFGKMALHCAY